MLDHLTYCMGGAIHIFSSISPTFPGTLCPLGSSDALAQLLTMAMKLFHKMIDSNTPFHLTLINVCFSNLQSKNDSKGSITSFFTQKSPKKALPVSQHQVNVLDIIQYFLVMYLRMNGHGERHL